MKSNGDGEYPQKIVVEFNEKIEIRGKKVPAARYKGILLISKKSFVPRQNKEYLVFLPAIMENFPFYVNGESVYSVKIIKSEEIKRLEVFKNTYILHSLLRKFNKKEAVILFNEPNERYDSYFVLVYVKNINKEEIIKRFLRKNLLLKKRIEAKDGVIKLIINHSEDMVYINTILFHDLPNILSET